MSGPPRCSPRPSPTPTHRSAVSPPARSARRGGLAAVPRLLDLVIGGVTDVEAAEILGAMTSDGSGTALADRIVGELTAELAAHPADTALRIRLTQALVEIPGEAARSALRILATDADAVVARIAAASPSFRER
nr:hypothetical protein [Gordonia sp. NB41Y]